MYLNIIVFILAFLIIFFISLFCLLNKTLVIDNLYLIIPAICIGLWALYCLIQNNFNTEGSDINAFYKAGKQILIDPSRLYDAEGFHYTPIYAIIFAFSISLLPYFIASDIFFMINYIWGVLTIIEFDKILILMDVKKKINRFMFIMIISNGYFVFNQFLWNQSKYLLFLILLFIIRREFKFKKDDIEKDLKYYLINYSLFVLAIGMAPYFIFFLLIYIFQDIPSKEFFKKENVEKYFIIIFIFLTQNILFIIYPSQFFIFLISGLYHPIRRNEKIKLLYLREFIDVSYGTMTFITIFFTIILSVITLILILNNKLGIEEKFAYFSIAYIFFGVYSYPNLLSLTLFSLALLLFVPYLNQNAKGIEFIKCNKILLIGLMSIIGILFASSDFIFYDLFPLLEYYPSAIFYYSRWIFLLSVMLISLILLHLKLEKNKNLIK
jgi:hypothetical protein